MKIKYDVTGVEAGGDRPLVPAGVYRAKILEINEKPSAKGNDMLEVVLEIVGHKQYKGARLWNYVVLNQENAAFRLRELLEALGIVKSGQKKAKGEFDPTEHVGTIIQIKTIVGKNQNDEPRAEVRNMLPVGTDEDDDGADEDEPDEPDEDEDDVYDQEELESLANDELKGVAEELGVETPTRLSAKSKPKLIAAILAAQEEDEDEDEPDDEDEDEPDDDEEDDAEDGDEDEDDEDEEDDDEVDYSEWSIEDLKAELKERGLKPSAKKSVMVRKLEKDDESDEDAF